MDTKSNSIYDGLYARLNPKQKLAVDTIQGPVMVMAGPGTGKTSILTIRIANILLKTDAKPDEILALTFTESGAKTMRRKLVEIIGEPGYRVHIHTFHGFCQSLINTYPDKYEKIIGRNPARDVDRFDIIVEAMNRTKTVLIQPVGEPTYYVRHCISAIRELKQSGIDPDRFKQLNQIWQDEIDQAPDLYNDKGAHKGKIKKIYTDRKALLAKNAELASVYSAYNDIYRERKLYDFEDMILETITLMKSDEDFLRGLQEHYQYVLADEHQDTNRAQNIILDLLTDFHDNPNLFIVGDEKQAIYRFQGASLENFFYFKSKYPKAPLIDLEENYRSSQIILDASHGLIENTTKQEGMIRTKLRGQSTHTRPIYILSVPDHEQEMLLIASLVIRAMDKTSPENIAVLYTRNSYAQSIHDILAKAGIPSVIESDSNILDHSIVRQVLRLANLVLAPYREEYMTQTLFAPYLDIPFKILARAISQARKERVPLMNVLETIPEGKIFLNKLESWTILASTQGVSSVIESIVNQSGLLAYALKEDPEYMKVLHIFYRHIQSYSPQTTLQEFLLDIERMKVHGISINSTRQIGHAVRLMTVHKAKGLEFDTVILAHMIDGVWSNRKNRTYFYMPDILVSDKDLDDDRRLMYVALTRARKEVYMTHALLDNNNKETIISPLVYEILPELKVEESGLDYITLNRNIVFDHIPEKQTLLDRDFFGTALNDHGLAVTALNNYIDCVWRFIFLNILRVPQFQSPAQIYGTIIHNVLQRFFSDYKTDDALVYFQNQINNAMSGREREQYQAKGLKALNAYINSGREWSKNIKLEYDIRTPYTFKDWKFELRGVYDKVELDTATVVDYKTGKPRSRANILGETKDSNGEYFRQLSFYRLLADRNDGNPEIRKGTIDFIEPLPDGRCVSETFDLKSSDCDKVIADIEMLCRDLYTGEYIEKSCREKDCEWCTLARDTGFM